MGTRIYQLYDGTLKLDGCKKLLWHRKRISEEKIQVLSPAERGIFPFRPGGGGGAPSKKKGRGREKERCRRIAKRAARDGKEKIEEGNPNLNTLAVIVPIAAFLLVTISIIGRR